MSGKCDILYSREIIMKTPGSRQSLNSGIYFLKIKHNRRMTVNKTEDVKR